EQVRGEEMDARSDLFSFGAVLYEMATGNQAFSSATTGVISHAILERAPTPIAQSNRSASGELDRIVAKALEKDRKLRYQSASDISADLHRLKRDSNGALGSAAATTAADKATGSTTREPIPVSPAARWKVLLAAI